MAIDWGKVGNVAGDVGSALTAVYGTGSEPAAQQVVVVEEPKPAFPMWGYAAIGGGVLLLAVLARR